MLRENNNNELIDATGMGFRTLVGICAGSSSEDDFPLKRGNCFSVYTADGSEYNIVNFCAENLDHLIEYYELDFPIKIYPITKRIAVIHDYRIPDEYYQKRWCEVCCPDILLPITQRLVHDLDVKRGNRTEHNGFVTIKLSDRYELKKKERNNK